MSRRDYFACDGVIGVSASVSCISQVPPPFRRGTYMYYTVGGIDNHVGTYCRRGAEVGSTRIKTTARYPLSYLPAADNSDCAALSEE